MSGYVDHGHHAAFRLDAFKSLGGYDPTFTHNEDAEYDCRQAATGRKVYLDAAIRIGYFPRSRLRLLWKQYRAYGKGRARTIQKHPTAARPRQYLVVANFFLVLLSMLVGAFFPLAFAWAALYAGALAATSIVGAFKMKCSCGLLTGPAALTMHFSWAVGFIEGIVICKEDRWTAPTPAAGKRT